MNAVLHKKSIIKKTIEVGGLTFLSRLLGIIRVFLVIKYLGASAISDAFLTAYKIPNSLRKIFAEGALSAAFIPTLVHIVHKKDQSEANKLMSLAFLLFEGAVLVLCALFIIKAETVITLIAPGFSIEQIQRTAPLLKIVMPFIFFLSSSALLAGALQAVGHFFVPAFSPVMLNIVFIASLITCISLSLPVEYLCFFILFGGLLQLIMHIVAYIKLNFAFEAIDEQAWNNTKIVLLKFFPCLVSMSVMEVGLFIDTSFASYLPHGSISLVHYANRFMGIPLGVFAVAFSTILLPHFSRVSTYAPKRLHFYVLESTKFVFWVTVPVMLIMGFFAEKIFYTIFLSKNFSLEQVMEAQTILIAFLLGLFFFSLNKILLNIYYALHVTWIPMIISIIATLINIGMNMLLMRVWQTTGLALATTISGIAQTILSLYFLHSYFNFQLYLGNLLLFILRYITQLFVILSPFLILYYIITSYIVQLPEGLVHFFLFSFGFWLWVGPLCCLVFLLLFLLRNVFSIRLYFLD